MSTHTYLVTGGAGFIGSNFVLSALARPDTRVVNLDKLTYAGNPDNLSSLVNEPRHRFVAGDIRDRALVARLLEEHDVSAVLNFAAESHVDRSIDGPGEFVTTNVLGTFELLEAARAYHAKLSPERARAFRFLHVSTDEVYGSLGATGLFTEETAYAPNSPYAATKAGADHLVRAYFETYRLPTLTTNCSNNYGPRQFPEKLIPLMILNALEQRPLPVYGDGKNVRDWLFVDDHCEAILRVLERAAPGSTYNVGGHNEQTNIDIVHTLCALLDRMAPPAPGSVSSYRELIKFVQDRPGHDRRYAIDAGKIKQDLGWAPKHDFAQGIEKTIRWYLDNREWCRRISDGRYRRERLGLSSATEA